VGQIGPESTMRGIRDGPLAGLFPGSPGCGSRSGSLSHGRYRIRGWNFDCKAEPAYCLSILLATLTPLRPLTYLAMPR
jgi:hypothetical protein